MQVTRREFLKDMAFAAALVGLPDWAMQLDEADMDSMMALAGSGHGNPWPWVPANNIGPGNPHITALNRIAFGPRPGDVDRIQQIGIDNYIEEQLAPAAIDDSALDERLAGLYPSLAMSIGELFQNYPQPRPTAQADRALRQFRQNELGLREERQAGPAEAILNLQEATLVRAIYSRRQLFEVVVDFWTNHFNIDIRKNDCKWTKTVDDRDVIRKNALGNFRELLLASAQSPAMIEYLDNRTNVKGVANENYAREIMELHSLGVDGGYTQKDVAELSRCFTGWTVRPARMGMFGMTNAGEAGTFFFNARQHDDGPKRVLGINIPPNGGINDAIRVIDALAVHPSTAKYISTKLVQRFVSDTPPPDLVASAAKVFLSTDGNLRSVLSTILHSDNFKTSFAKKIKRPFEFVAAASRAVDLQLEDARAFVLSLQLMGQGLFTLTTPDGYPDVGSAWINTNNMLARWNFSLLLAGNRVPRGKVDLRGLFGGANWRDTGQAADYLVRFFLNHDIPSSDRQKLIDAVSTRGANAPFDASRTSDLVALILASPHFQYR